MCHIHEQYKAFLVPASSTVSSGLTVDTPSPPSAIFVTNLQIIEKIVKQLTYVEQHCNNDIGLSIIKIIGTANPIKT